MTTSQELAAYAAQLTWHDIPQKVQTRASQAFVDAISVMFAGTRTRAARIAAGFAHASSGTATLACGKTAAAPQAAFANGVAAAALDFEDGHYLGGGIHPASVVVPALLATSTPGTTLRDFLVAQVAGYEVGLRLASLLWPRIATDWYHTTGTAGAVAAAVACARLRGLDAEGLHRGLVAAWQHAPMATFALPMAKESIGWAALVGMSSAQLVADGYLAAPNGAGFTNIAGFPSNPLDLPEAADDPFVQSYGEVFESGHTYFKKYAACRYVHAAAHGLQALLDEHAVAVDQLAAVKVGTHRGALFLADKTPKTLDNAQYSFPHVLAAVALEGRAGAEEVTEERLEEPARLQVSALVEVDHDAEMDAQLPHHYGSRVAVQLTDGRVLAGEFLHAPGDAELPMSQAELSDKWRRCLATVLPVEAASSILDCGADLDAAVDQVLRPALEATTGAPVR